MTLALCTALRVCWTVDGMWQLGYLLFRLPPTIPCIECDLLSLSGAEAEQRVQLSHCEKTSAQESSTESYFFVACVPHSTCVPKGRLSVGSLARNFCRWQVHVEGETSVRGSNLRIWELSPISPNLCFVVFTVVVCSVVFVFVSWLEGFCRSVHSVISRPCNIPKVTSNLLAFFFSPRHV